MASSSRYVPDRVAATDAAVCFARRPLRAAARARAGDAPLGRARNAARGHRFTSVESGRPRARSRHRARHSRVPVERRARRATAAPTSPGSARRRGAREPRRAIDVRDARPGPRSGRTRRRSRARPRRSRRRAREVRRRPQPAPRSRPLLRPPAISTTRSKPAHARRASRGRSWPSSRRRSGTPSCLDRRAARRCGSPVKACNASLHRRPASAPTSSASRRRGERVGEVVRDAVARATSTATSSAPSAATSMRPARGVHDAVAGRGPGAPR